MKTILSYPLPLHEPSTRVEMPAGAVLLTASMSGGYLSYAGRAIAHLWAVVDPDARPEQRRLTVWRVGQEVELADNDYYVASVTAGDGSTIWHLFDAGTEPATSVSALHEPWDGS